MTNAPGVLSSGGRWVARVNLSNNHCKQNVITTLLLVSIVSGFVCLFVYF